MKKESKYQRKDFGVTLGVIRSELVLKLQISKLLFLETFPSDSFSNSLERIRHFRKQDSSAVINVLKSFEIGTLRSMLLSSEDDRALKKSGKYSMSMMLI
ncbi:hypothetical protein CEXT_409751 [Caerostris extrusa]|uniref:Uncharacterized protein n=1 Tax=Caerostris extrusa TaxID=172846 RepID=A0AAV4SWL2_CAEEX|nr:hypothetical protein CEXT_409751 [Caerostris extrusa]